MTSTMLQTPLLMLLVSLALPAQAQLQLTNGTAPATAAVAPIPATVVKGSPSISNGAPATQLPVPKTQAQPTPGAAPIPPLGPATVPSAAVITPPVTNTAKPAVVPVPTPTLSDLGRSLRNYFTEDELELLFQYMKESVIASFKDEEVTLPPDLSFKLEILLVRLKKESNHYMDNLIKQLEADLKKSIKEKLTPPPPKDQPYNPWLSKPWE